MHHHHSRHTRYSEPGRRAHLSALIKDIEAEIADISEALDEPSPSTFMATSGPVGGVLGSASADRVASFRYVRGQLLAYKLEVQTELEHTVEALAAEEDVARIEVRQKDIEREVASRRETLARAISQFCRDGDYRAAALYARERAMLRDAIQKEFDQ